MKGLKISKKNPFLEEGIRKFADFMNSGSEEAEQLIQEKRCMIFDYKLNKFLYKNTFDGDIEDDEEFNDILGDQE
ncbi:MAG: hypothetical protein PVH61_00145 [Candidatus Aminicenantes bacterium]|jgi:hypothetical protein